ncbi:MAG TPA: MarR family transcriptional regulator [Solirubrobacteraceae bacterium]|nr:MarR family transcriptional regulator [Solirubrobacteraceae bacterium]
MSKIEALGELARAFKGTLAARNRARGRETHKPGELTDAQYSLLFGLRDPVELPTGELAFAADLSPASTTEMLEGLGAAGLVQRRRSEQDRRVVLVSLTARGRELVEARRAEFEPRWRAAFGEFSEAELRSAVAVLDQLRDFFDELSRARSAEADAPVEVGSALPRTTHAKAGTG